MSIYCAMSGGVLGKGENRKNSDLLLYYNSFQRTEDSWKILVVFL